MYCMCNFIFFKLIWKATCTVLRPRKKRERKLCMICHILYCTVACFNRMLHVWVHFNWGHDKTMVKAYISTLLDSGLNEWLTIVQLVNINSKLNKAVLHKLLYCLISCILLTLETDGIIYTDRQLWAIPHKQGHDPKNSKSFLNLLFASNVLLTYSGSGL